MENFLLICGHNYAVCILADARGTGMQAESDSRANEQSRMTTLFQDTSL